MVCTLGVAGVYCSSSNISSRYTTAPGVAAMSLPTMNCLRSIMEGIPPLAMSCSMFWAPRMSDRPPVSNAFRIASGLVPR